MRKFKWWEKLLTIFLTPAFISTFFLIIVATLRPFEDEPRLFVTGCVILAVNVSILFGILKILRKYYDYRNEKGIKIYLYSIIAIPLLAACAFLAYYERFISIAVYIIITVVYLRLIEGEFGKLRLKIDNRSQKLKAGDITSFNGTVKVYGKNKHVKSMAEEIKDGDVIEISRGSEIILNAVVTKKKKSK